jgi:hypothetical protein
VRVESTCSPRTERVLQLEASERAFVRFSRQPYRKMRELAVPCQTGSDEAAVSVTRGKVGLDLEAFADGGYPGRATEELLLRLLQWVWSGRSGSSGRA